MSAETLIRLANQCLIETPLFDSGFVTRHKQNSAPSGIEGKSDAPHAICRIEPELLHIGIARPFERIHAWTAETWAKRLEQLGVRKQLILHFIRKLIEFKIEGRIKADMPAHAGAMLSEAYVVHYICMKTHIVN